MVCKPEAATVGTPVTRRPPYRPGRAVFPHPVPRLHSHPRKGRTVASSYRVCYGPQGGWLILIRPTMSGMRCLSGLRASVESFPMWWAFPTPEYSARYDSSNAYGGRSRCQYFSTSLSRLPHQRYGSRIAPCPGFPFCAHRAVDHPLTRPACRNVWGLPRSFTSLFRHATA